jgi:hypothetical protein
VRPQRAHYLAEDFQHHFHILLTDTRRKGRRFLHLDPTGGQRSSQTT